MAAEEYAYEAHKSALIGHIGVTVRPERRCKGHLQEKQAGTLTPIS